MDPRVKASAATLVRQFTLSKSVYDDINRTRAALDSARGFRTSLRDLRGRSSGDAALALDSLDRALAALEGGGGGGGGPGGGGGGGGGGAPTLAGLMGQLSPLYDALQDADVAPTTQLVAAVQDAQRSVTTILARWSTVRTRVVQQLSR
jgi:hypothetical protein